MRQFLRRGVAAVLLSLLPWGAALAAEATLADGWRDVGYLDYHKALGSFTQVLKGLQPGSDEYLQASLGEAVCLQYQQPDAQSDKDRASELYEGVIKASDGKAIQAMALLLRGRLADQIDYYGDKPDTATARACYERILKDWPSSDLIDQAALYLAELDVLSMQPEQVKQGIASLEAWLAQRPHNKLAVTQWMLVGLGYTYPLNEPTKAVEAYQKAEALGLPRHIQLDSFCWRVGNLAERAGDKALAIRYFTRIISEVKRSGFAYEAQLRIRDLGGNPPPLENPFADVKEAK